MNIDKNKKRFLNMLTDKYAKKIAKSCIEYDNITDKHIKEEIEFMALTCFSFIRMEADKYLK